MKINLLFLNMEIHLGWHSGKCLHFLESPVSQSVNVARYRCLIIQPNYYSQIEQHIIYSKSDTRNIRMISYLVKMYCDE